VGIEGAAVYKTLFTISVLFTTGQKHLSPIRNTIVFVHKLIVTEKSLNS